MGYEIIKDCFPNYLENLDIQIEGKKVILFFKTKRTECKCPTCGGVTTKYRNYYNRKIQDLPIIDKQLFLNLRLKKFQCENPNCERNYFTETIDDLAKKGSRRTNRLDELLTRLALINSAEEGARICKKQMIDISGDTLLRLSKKWDLKIDKEKIIAVGVDDFALKKNIDMEQLL
ncbi:MAG: transposase family protein [Bacillota bacterium]|nr:transposase family protein [Bacillota bacterium]